MSKTTHKFIELLDKKKDIISVDIVSNLYKNQKFIHLFQLLIGIYKNIDINKCNIKVTKNKIFKEDGCQFFSLFLFLHEMNLIDNYLSDYSKADIDSFKMIIVKQNFKECCRWVNSKGRRFMHNIFTLIQNESIKRNILPENILNNLLRIEKDIYSEFTSLEVIDEIETLMNFKILYNVTYKNIQISLTIFNNSPNFSRKELEIILKRTIIMAELKQKQTNRSRVNINMVLIMSRKKKLINMDGKTLGPNEINSGVSTYSENENDTKVVIYRKEEINKLIIHELIHNLKLDFVFIDYDMFHRFVNINPDTIITFNESYTEIMACIINSIICSYEFKNKKNRKLACQFINYELCFNLFQVSKILVNYGFNHAGDFFCKHKDNRYKQNTNVFSYFIIKTGLLLNIEHFLDFIFANDFLEQPISKNYSKKQEYIKLVINSILDEKYQNSIDVFMKNIIHSKQIKKLSETLRMTIIE